MYISPDFLLIEYETLIVEVAKAQAQAAGKPLKPENRYVDIYKEKPIKVVTKVLVPVKEHPRVNMFCNLQRLTVVACNHDTKLYRSVSKEAKLLSYV